MWTTFHQRNAIHREAGLECGVFVELIQHYLCISIAFDFDNDTHIAFGLVADTRDTFDLLIVHEVSDILHEVRLHYTIWQLANHDTLATVVFGLDLCFRTDDDTSATCLVCIAHALITVDSTTCWEVRCLDMLHEFSHGDWLHFGILHTCHCVLHVCHATVDYLAQVVGWHVRCHTYCDTACSVHQQVREATWQYHWLAQRVVEVQLHIHGIFVYIAKHLFGKFREACFGITHCCCTVAVNRTKVTLSVHQHVAHVPWLCHTHERAIDTAIAVRVVLTHYLTHDTCGFLGWLVTCVAQLIHTKQHTAVYWLEAIAHVRQCAGYNHTHRVIDVRGSHFLVNLYRNNSVVVNHLYKVLKVSRFHAT